MFNCEIITHCNSDTLFIRKAFSSTNVPECNHELNTPHGSTANKCNLYNNYLKLWAGKFSS